MGSYFVSPPEAPINGWTITEAELAEAVRTRWPDAEIEAVSQPESLHILRWTLTIDGNWVDGSLTKKGWTVHLEGDIRAVAIFALWLRELVPPSQPLLFYDEGYSFDIAITSSTSPEDLVAPSLTD